LKDFFFNPTRFFVLSTQEQEEVFCEASLLLQAIGSLPAQAGRDGFSGSLVEGRNQRKSGLFRGL